MSNIKITDAVIDLETLSTRPDAVITNIGIVGFDRFSKDPFPSLEDVVSGYWRIETESQFLEGRRADSDTLSWWNDQHPLARHEVYTSQGRLPLQTVLKELEEKWFLGRTRIWGNGVGFDNVLLQHAALPRTIMNFRNDCCFRTLRTVFGSRTVPLEKCEGHLKHHALHDAYYEAYQLHLLYKDIDRMQASLKFEEFSNLPSAFSVELPLTNSNYLV